MDFKVVLDILVKKLKENKIDFALIGGFALLSSGVERMTNDLDLLVPKECSDKVSIIMSELDYSNIFKSDETAMFDSPVELFGRVDFMFAQRKYTEEMLERAKEISVFNNAFRVKVVLPEDIIGLKIQSCSINPDRYVKDMLDVEMEHCTKTTKAIIEEDIDVFFPADDIAFKTGLFLPPKLMKEIWIPRMAKLIEPVVNEGIPIIFHSDGRLDEIVEDLIEMGLDCLHPLDPYGIDYRVYKKKYGNNLSFSGNIDIEFPLAKGTPQDVKKDVIEHLKVMMPGGGYILSSSHSIVNYIPFENFVTMINTVHEYGKY